MIFSNLKIFLQNIRKNNLIVNTILELKADFNIVFIQEPSWSTICSSPSSNNCEGEPLVSITNYPNWLTFSRLFVTEYDYPRVAIYINIRLAILCFAFHKDVIDHRNILLISFFNNNDIFWLMNIYSDLSHLALKYLKDTKVYIQNLSIMTGDFNIHDSLWDLLFPHYSFISDDLLIIADLFNLELSSLINQAPTRYSDNDHNSNSIIGLMFLHNGSSELDNYLIHSDWYLMSNHTSLTITIPISKEHIDSRKRSIIKDSKEEMSFIKDFISSIRNLHTSNLLDEDGLERVVIEFTKVVECTWEKNSKFVNITKHSKRW